jgi:hypothetical protein
MRELCSPGGLCRRPWQHMVPELWRGRKINSWACSCLNWFPMSMNSKELVLACARILALLQCTEVRLELWHVNIWAWRNCLVTRSSLGRQNISEGLNTYKGADLVQLWQGAKGSYNLEFEKLGTHLLLTLQVRNWAVKKLIWDQSSLISTVWSIGNAK